MVWILVWSLYSISGSRFLFFLCSAASWQEQNSPATPPAFLARRLTVRWPKQILYVDRHHCSFRLTKQGIIFHRAATDGVVSLEHSPPFFLSNYGNGRGFRRECTGGRVRTPPCFGLYGTSSQNRHSSQRLLRSCVQILVQSAYLLLDVSPLLVYDHARLLLTPLCCLYSCFGPAAAAAAPCCCYNWCCCYNSCCHHRCCCCCHLPPALFLRLPSPLWL